MPKGNFYCIQGAEGTARQLYAELASGLENPPTFVAFATRLKRKETNKAELCRPNLTYSSAGKLAKIKGGRKGGLASKKKQKRSPVVKLMTVTKSIPLVGGKPYFRPGSLTAWPRLQDLER